MGSAPSISALPGACVRSAVAERGDDEGLVERDPHADPVGQPSRLGVFVALTFVGLPFVVRTLQPVLAELEPELEEAAASWARTAGRHSDA